MTDQRYPYYICLQNKDNYKYTIQQLTKSEFLVVYNLATALSHNSTISLYIYPFPDLMTLYDNYDLKNCNNLKIDAIPYEHYDKMFENYVKEELYNLWCGLQSK